MTATPWNEGATFLGIYHGVKYYTRGGKIICLFGWMPKEFETIKKFQAGVRAWEKE